MPDSELDKSELMEMSAELAGKGNEVDLTAIVMADWILNGFDHNN